MNTASYSSQFESVEYWDRLVKNSSDIIVKYDPKGKVVYINETLEKYVDIRRFDLIGKSLSECQSLIALDNSWREVYSKAVVCRKPTTAHATYISEKVGKRIFEISTSPDFDDFGDITSLTFVLRDITPLLPQRERIDRFANQWQLLVKLSTEFIVTNPENANEKINTALSEIGQITQADRCYIIDYDFINSCLNNTFEWCADGVQAQIDNLQGMPMALAPEWVERHSVGEELIISDVSALHPTRSIKASLEMQGIKSLLTVPIFVSGQCEGFVGVDFVKSLHDTQKEEIQLLQVFASLIGNLRQKFKLEKERQVSDLRFKIMVQKAFAGIYVLRNEKFEFVNQLFCRLTGHTESELKSPDFQLSKLVVARDDHARRSIAERHNGDLSPKSYQIEIETQNGIKKQITVNTTGIADERGTYTLGIAFDSSKEAEQQQAIEEINALLKQQNKTLHEFAHLASHNLKAPLANIKGLIGQLEMDLINGNTNHKLIDGIEQCAKSMNETLDDMIAVIKTTEGNESMLEKEVDLNALLKKIRSTLSLQLESTEAKITTELECKYVKYNHGHLENILLNLMTNAIRYHSPERSLHIQISSKKNQDGRVEIAFTDNGLGIDLKKYGHRMFKMYERFHDHPESRGLGLYLVKLQIEKTNGKIEVASTPDQGTTFHITL